MITEIMKMHERCSYCGTKYKMEPNFFFGAMYVSYAVAVAACILIFVICHFVFQTTIMQSFIVILIGLILLMPPITRISRNIYINLFINYEKSAGNRLS
ncbi:MAG TPA: DUF983 domain-containing protein [Flavobacterium sp.]